MLFFCKQVFCQAHLSLRALMSFCIGAKIAHASALGDAPNKARPYQNEMQHHCIICQYFSLAFIGVEADQVILWTLIFSLLLFVSQKVNASFFSGKDTQYLIAGFHVAPFPSAVGLVFFFLAAGLRRSPMALRWEDCAHLRLISFPWSRWRSRGSNTKSKSSHEDNRHNCKLLNQIR